MICWKGKQAWVWGWGFNVSIVEGEFHSEDMKEWQTETHCYLREEHASHTCQTGWRGRESEEAIMTRAREKGKRSGRSWVPRFHRLYRPL